MLIVLFWIQPMITSENILGEMIRAKRNLEDILLNQ
jgi:hypothetical protein